MTKQTDKEILDELIIKLYNRGVAAWLIAHTATQDGLYLSANLLTDYDTIAQLLDAHYPKKS